MGSKGNNGNNREIILAVILLALGIVCIVVGFYFTKRTDQRMVFTILSIPAAILIVTGAWKIVNYVRNTMNPSAGSERNPYNTGSTRQYPLKKEFDAQVLGVTRNIRVEGEKEVYYIVCKYKEEETGREFTYTSRPLNEYPGRDVIGKTVHVTIDSRDPDNYKVDIEPLLKSTDRY